MVSSSQPEVNLVESEKKVLNAGRIPYESFKNTCITMYSIACFTLAARILIRISTRRRLYLDDFFIILGFIILSSSTYLVLHFARGIFITEALLMGLIQYEKTEDFLSYILISTDTFSATQAFNCVSWSAIFCVKFSFLALFKVLIRRLSRRLTIYCWVVVGVTIMTWIFVASSFFIVCPRLSYCKPEPRRPLSLAMSIICSVLDIATDVMIVSIPVLVLKKTQMGLSRKLGLGATLCLSVSMVLIALVRVGGHRIQGLMDPTWQVFWQYVEACVAVIMGSATAFRSLFVGENSRKAPEKELSYSIRQRLMRKSPPKKDWEDTNGRHLPTVPSATLSGLRTFIHRHGRTRVGLTSQRSNRGTLLSEKDDTQSSPC